MQTHNLKQGTDSWHQFRSVHYGASEASAMLGLSKQLTRNDLLLYKSTGKSKEYSDWVQKNILDYGHEVEAEARILVEEEIQDDLFPVTCSEDDLSASCDGLTMEGSIAFEHKQWSRDLVDYIEAKETLPDTHMPQCQQILMVTGAKKVIFVCSDGTENNRSILEIFPDQVWFQRIKTGWDQFKNDLANYQPKAFADKPEPAAIMQLPALSIQIKGEVTLSNLPQFKAAAETFIANINTDLKSDEDFVNAEATVKFCGDTEDKLEAAKSAAIGQTASIDELMRTIDHIKESIRQKRLTLEKSVKTQKENIKTSIIKAGFDLCYLHVAQLQSEFSKVNFEQLATSVFTRQNFETACKNKRTLASLHNAVDTEVAAIKIKLDDLARVIRKNLTHLPEDLSLFRDLQSIITKPEDDFRLLVQFRLDEQKRKDDEAAQKAIADAKSAEEKAKIQPIKTPDEQLQPVLSNGVVPQSVVAQSVDSSKQPESSDSASNVKAIGITTTPEQRKILLEVSESMIENGVDVKAARNLASLIFADRIKHVTINF